jgi:DNA-binding NarL/FixJ family response regulator
MADLIRVAVIEDNEVFREALELLLGLDPEVEVVGSAPDGEDAVGLCKRTGPDVLVVDYRLPGPDGVQVTSAVRTACPGVVVLCLTAGVNAREEEALRDAGAVGCMTKNESLDEIVAAIKQAGRRGG